MQGHLYSAHYGAPEVVLNSPLPKKNLPDGHKAKPLEEIPQGMPNFRQPRYLKPEAAYLAFVPKYYNWREPYLKSLRYSRQTLPIVEITSSRTNDQRFILEEGVQRQWLALELTLHVVSTRLIHMGETFGFPTFPKLINPYFCSGRLNFTKEFRTEAAARFVAWRSRQLFYPLIGIVSMAYWIAEEYEADIDTAWKEYFDANAEYEEATAKDQNYPRSHNPPRRPAPKINWRDALRVSGTGAEHLSSPLLDELEKTILRNFDAERVGCFYEVEPPLDAYIPGDRVPYISMLDRERRADIERLIVTILRSTKPIPVYLSWGPLPREIYPSRISQSFHNFIPPATDLDRFSKGSMAFSPYTPAKNELGWDPKPNEPAGSAIAPAIPSVANISYVPPATPFPPRPKDSAQKAGESIHAFFSRRKESNKRSIAKESTVERQRRTQREEHARKSRVPSKTCFVFVWEDNGGHFIRQRVHRGEVEDLWADYPSSQRRYDAIRNEWDVCVLFENDPAFGKPYDPREDDEDDDDYDHVDWHPTVSQNATMASVLPAAATNPLQAHDAEADLSENQVPEGVDLGPDVEEGDLPQARDIASCSNDLMKTVVSRFGKAPQKHDPVYESIGQNVWDTLDKRFGFVNPLLSSDRRVAKFDARDPPKKPIDEKLLPVIIGVPDIGPTLASEGLVSILSTFFGQCVEARSAGSIDKLLLDYHRRSEWPSSPFQFTCESLTSMRTGDVRVYYVLRRHDGGDGSQVVLLPRATDLLEVLRRGWGPDITDVVQHLLARGTTFWLAFMSRNIKQRPRTSILRTHVKRDIDSGLGYRPHEYKFTHQDYSIYLALRSDRVMHGPRGRIALQYGGAIARIASETIADVDFFRQFDEAMYDDGDCLWDGRSEFAYWHEFLGEHELDLVCGVYNVGTGVQPRPDRENGMSIYS